VRRFGPLFLLFALVPVVELALLVWIGGRVGVWPTLALVVVTAAAGSYLARREGSGVLRRFREKLATGALPSRELLDGLIVLVAGVLLLTPGVLSDVAGLLGLLPPTRALARRRLEAWFRRAVTDGRVRVVGARPFGAAPGRPPVEDADVVEERRAPSKSAPPLSGRA
jgi:UPF0716 protein FxsA